MSFKLASVTFVTVAYDLFWFILMQSEGNLASNTHIGCGGKFGIVLTSLLSEQKTYAG